MLVKLRRLELLSQTAYAAYSLVRDQSCPKHLGSCLWPVLSSSWGAGDTCVCRPVHAIQETAD